MVVAVVPATASVTVSETRRPNSSYAYVVVSPDDVLTAADCGCLMHLGGGLARRRSGLKVLHLAEVLSPEPEEGP